MATEYKMRQLLATTKDIVDKHLKIEKEKGETFNVFSILKMERKENGTHSAFLKELLDPNGAHLKGNMFLKLFLEIIKYEQIDIHTAKVKTEHSIGERNDIAKTGGRVDIYIWDKHNKYITIENKINAPDQNVQIERYCNHNKENNRVYYLTLLGTEPSKESKGDLKSGEDFYIISYKDEIIRWLMKCLEAFSDSAILRESKKQYIILIKKMTKTMGNQQEYELKEAILKYFTESGYIANNFLSLKAEIGEDARRRVMEELQKRLGNDFEIYLGERIQNENAQIWIKYRAHLYGKLYFGIESFSYNAVPGLDVGILNEAQDETAYKHTTITKGNENLWPYYLSIEKFDEYNFDFDNGELLYKLHTDSSYKTLFINYIVEEVVKFIELHKEQLLEFLNNQTKNV